jgi:hypothetical protein
MTGRSWLVPLAAGGFGFFTFAISLGLVLVAPTNFGWLIHSGDTVIHFFGWHIFREAPWTNPIGASPLILSPVGSSVGLMDAIPVLAFAFKPFSDLLPTYFQYIGLWLLGCFVLQGVFGALLMQVATPRPALQLLGACLLVMSPPMVVRYGHAALTAHWLLLAALWLYFRFAHAPLGPWLLVAAFAAATHPYLCFMVVAIAAAAYARAVLERPVAWWRKALQFAAVLGCVAMVFWQCGYFVVGGEDRQGAGFGHFSMNVLSLVLPVRVYGVEPARSWTPTEGQYEGIAYLGVGLLALALVVVLLPAGRRALAALWRAHWSWTHLVFAIALCVLTLLALSPTIAFGSRNVLEYDPGWWGPLAIFRASGRMIWPVFYTLVFLILLVTTRLPFRVAVVLLAAAVGLQGAELSEAYRGLRMVRERGFTNELVSPFWQVVPRHYRRMVLYPTHICTQQNALDPRPFALVAGRDGLAINVGLAARVDMPRLEEYCGALEQEFRQGVLHDDAIYVLHRSLVNGWRARAANPALCTIVDQYGVCVARETMARWQEEYDIMFAVFPPLEELLEFHGYLEAEYRDRLQRPALAMSAPLEERLTLLTRYIWYRRGGCAHDEAAGKALHPVPGEARICGDPEYERRMPSVADTFAFRMMMVPVLQQREGEGTWNSRVDPEGEAVWLLRYISERMAGRDAYGARVEVINAIQGIAAASR